MQKFAFRLYEIEFLTKQVTPPPLPIGQFLLGHIILFQVSPGSKFMSPDYNRVNLKYDPYLFK